MYHLMFFFTKFAKNNTSNCNAEALFSLSSFAFKNCTSWQRLSWLFLLGILHVTLP